MEGAEKPRPTGDLLATISREMVGLHKEFGGKGPTKARTHWAGDDVVLVLMGGGFTAAEQTLYESGMTRSVQKSRHDFQEAMRQRLSGRIEDLTGRRVVAFMSSSHQDPDLVAELFVLEPLDPDSPVHAHDPRVPDDAPASTEE